MLSEILAIREESRDGKPGVLGVLCWPVYTLEPSVAPVLGPWMLWKGHRMQLLNECCGWRGKEQDCSWFSGSALTAGTPGDVC